MAFLNSENYFTAMNEQSNNYLNRLYTPRIPFNKQPYAIPTPYQNTLTDGTGGMYYKLRLRESYPQGYINSAGNGRLNQYYRSADVNVEMSFLVNRDALRRYAFLRVPCDLVSSNESVPITFGSSFIFLLARGNNGSVINNTYLKPSVNSTNVQFNLAPESNEWVYGTTERNSFNVEYFSWSNSVLLSRNYFNSNENIRLSSETIQAFDTLNSRTSIYLLDSPTVNRGQTTGYGTLVELMETNVPVFDITNIDGIVNYFVNNDDSGKLDPDPTDPDHPYIPPEPEPDVDFDWTKQNVQIDVYTGTIKGYGTDSLTPRINWLNTQIRDADKSWRDTIRCRIFSTIKGADPSEDRTKVLFDGLYDELGYNLSLRDAFELDAQEIPNTNEYHYLNLFLYQRETEKTTPIVILQGKFNQNKNGGYNWEFGYTYDDHKQVAMNSQTSQETIGTFTYDKTLFFDNDHQSGSDRYCTAQIHYRDYLPEDAPDDPNPDPDVPDPDPFDPVIPDMWTGSGVNTFTVDANILKWIEAQLFSGSLDNNFTSNMLSCIVSAKVIPFTANTKSGGTTRLRLGNKFTDIGEDGQFTEVNRLKETDVTTVTVNIPSPYSSDGWDLNYLDYEPYSTLKLYLPCTPNGWYELPLSVLRENGSKLNISYALDFVTGDIKYIIKCNEKPLFKVLGNCSIDIPFNTNHNAERTLNQISGVVKTTSAVVGNATTGASVGGVGGAIVGASIGLVGSLDNLIPKWTYESSGISSSIDSAFTYSHIMLLYEYPQTALSKDSKEYKHYNGRPLMQTRKLATMKGYTETSNIELSNVTCTDSEKAEIIALCNSGVYL